MTPKLVLPGSAVNPGLPKSGWLRISNVSIRNSLLNRSVILVVLVNEKSTSSNPGPRIEFRRRFPKWNTFAPPTAVTGIVKFAVPVQVEAFVGSHTVALKY